MIHEVRVFDASMNLKRVVPREEARRQFWDQAFPEDGQHRARVKARGINPGRPTIGKSRRNRRPTPLTMDRVRRVVELLRSRPEGVTAGDIVEHLADGFSNNHVRGLIARMRTEKYGAHPVECRRRPNAVGGILYEYYFE